MSFYEKSVWEELCRIREVLALQVTLMGFNVLRGQELPESDEAWLLEIITKAETMAFPENFSLIIRGLKNDLFLL